MPAPLISIVLPAYDQQGQLADCLDSILDQSFGGFEVIVVADPSPDCPAEVPQAARDGRVTVLRLSAAVGVGSARDAGAARAEGRYLLFLDSDHVLAPGALLTLAERVGGAADPDLVLFGHSRLHAGRVWPGAAAELLARAGAGREVFAPLEHPELFEAPAQVWDRLIARRLWTGAGLAFPEGEYEEVPVAHAALLAARRVVVLEQELVRIRRRHTVHPTGSPGSGTFDLFDQYERSFEALAARADAAPPQEREAWDQVARHLFTRMVRHYLFVFDLAGCVGRPARPRFFHRAAEHYQRYLPPGHRRPGGREGVKFSLLAGGAYSAFEVAKLSQIARTAVIGRGGAKAPAGG
ncbi:glycosyltransferase family 2 protein [Kitasatospora sp. NBC_01287]|uniref:glycosyltransferase family 2 protein n=1 Tax=Kitasatospora sp. NBC_01287 TaxID=2903573 RepID=UPI0022535B5C|nr:glycosyltransferase family 2 protein [Kitasatospora sp. NBC_01287]MCX4750247.1 glycosyltransferase family 2 protein [Kitasatospora sp. NBC_01287]